MISVRVCNVKNQPPSFGKLTFIPCRTPWYLKQTHPESSDFAASLAEMQPIRSKVKLNFGQIFWSSICASNLVTWVLYDISGVIWDLMKEQWPVQVYYCSA